MCERSSRRLVIFDVDGTIIGADDHKVPESAVKAIRRIRENGDYAVYYTGRPFTHVEEGVSSIGFDASICTMGAYIRIGEKILQDRKPDPKEAHFLVELVRKYRLDAAFESCIGIQFDRTRPIPAFLQGLKNHFAGRGFETDLDVDGKDFSFEKVCVWTNDDTPAENGLAGFEEEASRYLALIGKKPAGTTPSGREKWMAEFVAKGVSIPDALQTVKDYFKVATENCFAIGDSINDLPMLRCAGTAIAMGQAPGELKAQVDFVTKPIGEDGLAFAMKHFGLI